MKMKKTTISVSEIQRQLKGLREEVAAPRNFRARILEQLAAETGQAAPSSDESIWQQLMNGLARPMVRSLPALAASAVIGFGIWFAARPVQQVSVPVMIAQPEIAAPKVHPRPGGQLAKIRPKAQPVEVAKLSGTSAQQTQAPAGNAAPHAIPTQDKFSALPADGVNAAGLPTAEPSPGAMPKHEGLSGSSQVRRNRFMASRGEYAAIVFKLKAPGRARIECYDRNGKLIALLYNAEEAAGTFEVRWYGHDESGQMAPTGIYAVRIMTSEYNDTHKIVLVR